MASYLILLTLLFVIKDVACAKKIAVELRPPSQVVKEGESVQMFCQVSLKITVCRLEMPGSVNLAFSPSSLNISSEGISYYGKGFEKGQCGFQIHRVEEKHNGPITCTMAIENEITEVKGTMRLIVAKAPSRPDLRSPSLKDIHKEGAIFVASCIVRDGRPSANISWYLDDQKITDGLSDPIYKENNDLYTIEQNISRTLQASDNGKALKCVAQHPLLTDGKNTSKIQLNVIFPPKPKFSPVEQFGLVEGEEGEVSVTVMANPKPRFVWNVGEEPLYEGSSSGRFHVKHSTEDALKGPGHWKSVLVINSLTKEDVETTYSLRADNQLGEETYKVLISTSPEPKTADLGAGSIAAIVIAILVILLITVILVFARAKGRWCFAGKAGLRSAGESSDTESADHHGESKSKMIFTSVFKKKSDKVSADSPKGKDVTVNDEKVGNEDEGQVSLKPKNEEGVVYAELDLQNSPASRGLLVRPENDKTEYAEIIHTKDNK